MASSWFDKLTHAQQLEYCSNLKGSKRSKYCDVNTGLPLNRVDLASVKNNSEKEESREAGEGESGAKEHGYYDVKGEHVWAKKSNIKNIGADIEGSSRHKRNEGRDWGSVESMAENKDFTKKELFKLYAINPDEIKEGHESSYWVIKEILSKYPDQQGLNVEEKKEWITKYQTYLEHGKSIADEEKDPFRTAERFLDYLHSQYRALPNDWRNKLNRGLRDFLGNAKRRARQNSGVLGKLYGLLSNEQLLKLRFSKDQAEKAVLEKIGELGGASKFRDVIAGKPFLSTLTGEKIKTDRFSESSVYKDIVMERGGELIFKNVQESTDFLTKEMGLKAIQFGNSLPDNERTEHLLNTSHAFHDLSKALGVEPKFFSFNGELSIGFGSRGVAGSLAHYAPEHNFININRHNGYGSLGHETAHALDYYIAKKISSEKGVFAGSTLSEMRTESLLDKTSLEEEYKKLKVLRQKHLDRVVKEEGYKSCPQSFRTWIRNPKEVFARAFEAYAAKKLKDQGMKNTYLVSKIDHFAWPNEEESLEFEALFDSIFSKIRSETKKNAA